MDPLLSCKICKYGSIFLSVSHLVPEWILIRPAFLPVFCFLSHVCIFFQYPLLCYITLPYSPCIFYRNNKKQTNRNITIEKYNSNFNLRSKDVQEIYIYNFFLKRKSFLGHTFALHKKKRSVLFRNSAVGWSSREMLANRRDAPQQV